MKIGTFSTLLIILCLFTSLSCKKRKPQSELVEEVIYEQLRAKIAYTKQVRLEHCLEDLYQQASDIADSILLEEARKARNTTGKPPVPQKPEKPSIVELKDSTPVKPFLP